MAKTVYASQSSEHSWPASWRTWTTKQISSYNLGSLWLLNQSATNKLEPPWQLPQAPTLNLPPPCHIFLVSLLTYRLLIGSRLQIDSLTLISSIFFFIDFSDHFTLNLMGSRFSSIEHIHSRAWVIASFMAVAAGKFKYHHCKYKIILKSFWFLKHR